MFTPYKCQDTVRTVGRAFYPNHSRAVGRALVANHARAVSRALLSNHSRAVSRALNAYSRTVTAAQRV